MDKRLIRDVKEYQFDSELIEQLNTVKALFNDKERLFITAQNVQEIEPLLVSKNSNGIYSIDYESLTVMLLAIVKDLNNRITQLEKKKKK